VVEAFDGRSEAALVGCDFDGKAGVVGRDFDVEAGEVCRDSLSELTMRGREHRRES